MSKITLPGMRPAAAPKFTSPKPPAPRAAPVAPPTRIPTPVRRPMAASAKGPTLGDYRNYKQ